MASGFAIKGIVKNYRRIPSIIESIKSIRRSELAEGVYIVSLHKNTPKHEVDEIVNKIRLSAGNPCLEKTSLFLQHHSQMRNFYTRKGAESESDWLKRLPEDLRNINNIVKREALPHDKSFTFSPLYRILTDRLFNAAIHNCKYIIVTADLLMGCGITNNKVEKKLLSMGSILGGESMVPLHDIAHRLSYKGLRIENPIVGSCHDQCLVVPVSMLGKIFSSNMYPTFKNFYQCMALFLNAVVTHSAEKMDGKHERNKVIHMPNEVYLDAARRKYLEEKLEETNKLDAIDEEAREEYGNEIGRIGDKSTCLVFALSARDFFLTNRFNEDTPLYSGTERGIRFMCSNYCTMRDEGGFRPRLIMSAYGPTSYPIIFNTLYDQFNVQYYPCVSGVVLSFIGDDQLAPEPESLVDIVVRSIKNPSIRIFSGDGETVYQDGRRVDVGGEGKNQKFNREERTILNVLRIIKAYNEERTKEDEDEEEEEEEEEEQQTAATVTVESDWDLSLERGENWV
nr:hypothetical protein [White spot syndrome virus]WUY11849.1 hypothetical protein [White spot syndrome virus]